MYRYRLQRKEGIARPNVLGNHSFPVYTFSWKDFALSNDKAELEKMIPNGSDKYRIEDCGKETADDIQNAKAVVAAERKDDEQIH